MTAPGYAIPTSGKMLPAHKGSIHLSIANALMPAQGGNLYAETQKKKKRGWQYVHAIQRLNRGGAFKIGAVRENSRTLWRYPLVFWEGVAGGGVDAVMGQMVVDSLEQE